ncbi:MAG: TRAP transporter large permease subunit [Proteobacteria bacterium]|nr:TRAP transporter large permease subunit [Pseudomonadota bacterium]MBU1452071.1 TRAP transporter large permease subunit [Pseudomonadota bacterium]MBU2467268.1 TRAP transporter large permease subunit [Pseudomonadota bacterium]MBU2517353.1 TRAP transporter large permease subunit [Pseudomonadota bacterium]
MEPWMVASIIGVGLIALLMTGMPVAFALMGLSALFLLVFVGPTALFMVVAAAFKQVGSEVFIAIPLFVLMAAVLQSSGISEALYHTMHMWMGSLRGGLTVGTLVICAIIDALSGIGATATTTMGVIALPEMLKRGYHKHMAVGAITVGGALGPLIPPSVLMIIVGGYAQLSVGKLFVGGILPGLLVTAAWSAYVIGRCSIRRDYGPPMPKAEQGTLGQKILALRHVILPLGLAAFIMAGIYTGAFTPTEAAGFGALGAIIISIIHRKFSLVNMKEALQLAMRVSCMILWLVIGGGCYSALVTVTGTSHLVMEVLSGLPFGTSGILLVMLVIVLFMGMFIDPVAISMICIPVFLPITQSMGVDPLWFALMFVMAVVIGYITPPFGLNLFYMKGVTPEDITIMDIYRSATPYTVIMVGCLLLCFLFPQIMVWLPSFMK